MDVSFFVVYGKLIHVHVVQIWITVIKFLENHLNVIKRSNDPWNFPNFDMTVVLVHVTRRKKFEGRKRKLSPVRYQTCIVPSRNHEPSSELLRFVRGVCPNFRHTCQFFTTSSWWHDITPSKVSYFSNHFFIFLELKCHVTPCIRMHVSMSWDKYVWKFLLIYCTWN